MRIDTNELFNFEYVSDEVTIETNEKTYHKIINELLRYIEEVKRKDKTVSLFDIILDFSFKSGYGFDVISDVIQEDEYFKEFIKTEIEVNSNNLNNLEWWFN